MNSMKKTISILLCLLVLMTTLPTAFAQNGDKYVFNCDFTMPEYKTYVGDTESFEVTFFDMEKDFNACVYFTVDGERSIDYTMPNFTLKNGASAVFYWQPGAEYKNKAVNIGFCVEIGGERIREVTKSVQVDSEPPFVIDFKCDFIGFQKTVLPGETMYAEILCKNYGSEFSANAYFTVAGQKADDYAMPDFWLRDGRQATFYWQAGEEYLNQEVAIGFVIERQGEVLCKIEKNVSVVPYDALLDPAYVMTLVSPVYVEATVRYDTPSYRDVGLKSRSGSVAGGTKVTCISSKSDFSNQVRLPDGNVCWVPLSALNVSKKNYTKADDLTPKQKSVYVNAMGYTSSTDYLVWVNLERQKVNVFLKNDGDWEHIKTFSCASGTNANPTAGGIFKYYASQKKWDYDTYYVGPIMIFNGNYAFHSVLLRYDGSIYDGTVGRPASHGCIRLLPDDINWLFAYLPKGSTVVIK